MSKEKVRFITEEECDFGFQNCIETNDMENIGDYYESIKQIYRKKLETVIGIRKQLCDEFKEEKKEWLSKVALLKKKINEVFNPDEMYWLKINEILDECFQIQEQDQEGK